MKLLVIKELQCWAVGLEAGTMVVYAAAAQKCSDVPRAD